MEKMRIIPKKVRGMGNLLEKKQISDFKCYQSGLIKEDDNMNPSFFSMGYSEDYNIVRSIECSSVSECFVGETISLNAVIFNYNGFSISDKMVEFCDGSHNILGVCVTNVEGVASYEVTLTQSGNFVFIVRCDEISESISITCNKQDTIITV